MKRLIIILLFFTTSLHAEKIERLGFYNIQEILGDDKLTYKILKGCVSMNSAVTEIIKEEHPDLAKEFFETANYFGVSNLTNDYVNFMKENGAVNKSFFKGTFLGDDLNFCNEIRGAIEVSISHSKKNE